MRVWLTALALIGAVAIGLGAWLHASGQSAVVEIEGQAGFSSSGWIVGLGISLILVTVTLFAVLIPLLFTARQARKSALDGLVLVAQKTPELQQLVTLAGSSQSLPHYVVLRVSPAGVDVWARGRQRARVPRSGIGEIVVTDAVTSRRVPAIEIFAADGAATGLKFVPSRPHAELAPILRVGDVETLVERIRRVLGGASRDSVSTRDAQPLA